MATNAAGPARLSLRAPPHVPYISGHPGIPASAPGAPGPPRLAARVSGAIEVRVAAPVKAKWVRVEIRKFETVPPLPTKSDRTPVTTWDFVACAEASSAVTGIAAPGGQGQGRGQGQGQGAAPYAVLWSAEGKEFAPLATADFKFSLPLPLDIPPSLDGRHVGVRYELVGALCYREKGGLFRKESAPVMRVSQPLVVDRADLLPAWPAYAVPEQRRAESTGAGAGADAEDGFVSLTAERPARAYGPGDRMLFAATLRSSSPAPFRLKGFEAHLVETTTLYPPPPKPGAKTKAKASAQPHVQRTVIRVARAVVNESVGRGGEKSARLELDVPADKAYVTVTTAKTFRLDYEVVVEAVCEGLKGKLVVEGFKVVLGPYPKEAARHMVRDIGHVDSLCPPRPTPTGSFASSNGVSSARRSLQPSPNAGFGPSANYCPNGSAGPNRPHSLQPPLNQYSVQGYVERRRSSGTATTTTTATTMTEFGAERDRPSMGPGQDRAYATVPARGPPPTSFPAPRTGRAGSLQGLEQRSPRVASVGSRGASPDLDPRYAQSDGGHGDPRRMSTATAATFGLWDQGLRTGVPEDDRALAGIRTAPSPSPATPIASAHRSEFAPSPAPLSLGPSRPGSASVRPGPPSAYRPLTEKELYAAARARAIASQAASGVPLDVIGYDAMAMADADADADDAAPPPEYAPPRPAKEDAEYKAPSRPVSEYAKAAGTATPPAGTSGAARFDYLSAEEEKIQRKRYEDAERRVRVASGASAASGSSTALAPARTQATTPQPTNTAYPTAEEEKARLRYEMAVSSREQHSRNASWGSSVGQAAQTSTPAPVSPHGANANGANGSIGVIGGNGGPGPSTHARSDTAASVSVSAARFPTAEEEKDAMRLRFEDAQARVARAAAATSSAPSSPGMTTTAASSPRAPSSAHEAPRYPSAEEEKDLMRRRYEDAASRVARAAAPDAPPPFAINGSSSPSPAASSSAPRAGPSGYPSADEEKEAMRRRYEEATHRVARARLSSPPPPSPRAVSAPMLPAGPASPAYDGSRVGSAHGSPAARATHARQPSSPAVARDPTVKAGKARAASGADDGASPPAPPLTPPPPLPSKPPREYIDLLSPVEASFADQLARASASSGASADGSSGKPGIS
ncbi:hypothetical protein Q5752_006767 [Cryptotrichosporon argae]